MAPRQNRDRGCEGCNANREGDESLLECGVGKLAKRIVDKPRQAGFEKHLNAGESGRGLAQESGDVGRAHGSEQHRCHCGAGTQIRGERQCGNDAGCEQGEAEVAQRHAAATVAEVRRQHHLALD